MKYAIYGAGSSGAIALDFLGYDRVAVFVDSDESRKEYCGKPVICLDEFLLRRDDCLLVIASERHETEIERVVLQADVRRYFVFHEADCNLVWRNLPDYGIFCKRRQYGYREMLCAGHLEKYQNVAVYGQNEAMPYLLMAIATFNDMFSFNRIVGIADPGGKGTPVFGVHPISLWMAEKEADCIIVNVPEQDGYGIRGVLQEKGIPYIDVMKYGRVTDAFHDQKKLAKMTFEEKDALYQACWKSCAEFASRTASSFAPPQQNARVSSRDVSVVVQGYVDRKLVEAELASIRKYLPESPIILSTWPECLTDGLDYDVLVKSEDPGSCSVGLWEDEPIVNNTNRQIRSSQAGLAKVRTKYAMKLRSDMMLLGDEALGYLGAFPERKADVPQLFKERVIIGELYTRHYFHYDHRGRHCRVPKPFHPSDWSTLGLTEDLQKLYDVPLMPRKEAGGYQCKYPQRVKKNDYKYSWRYTSEQHIFFLALKKAFPDIEFEDWTDWTEELLCQSDEIMLNNFVILDFMHSKMINQKHDFYTLANSGLWYREKELMTQREFEAYYRKEFQPSGRKE